MSSVEFATDDDAGPAAHAYEVTLPIGTEPPPNWRKGTVDYHLLVTMNLAGERDVHFERGITVVNVPMR